MILHLESDAYPADALENLRRIAPLVCAEANSQSDLIELLEKQPAHTLFVTLGLRIDGPIMDASPHLRWIVSPTTGLDHVDLEAATRRDITVISFLDRREQIQDVSATAELTWGLLLSVARRIPEASTSVQEGNWDRTKFLGTQLRGKTLGIVGLGRLGRMVAAYGRAFEMTVVAHEAAPNTAFADELGIQLLGDEELLSKSDIVSLHLPLTPATNNWLSEKRIALLKHGALIINTARGELADETALARAIRCGSLGGIGTDVLPGDSIWQIRRGPSVLAQCALDGLNVVITPHIGGYADAAIQATRRKIVEIYTAGFFDPNSGQRS